MQASYKFSLHQQNLWLSPERCVFWQERKALILSDLHFGKSGHFRKSGIAIPQTVYKEDLQRLVSQIQYFRPERLIIVGDLFHSVANKELDFFAKWRNDFGSLQIQLVKGNHDILKKEWYASANISVISDHLAIDPFCFVHDIKEAYEPSGGIAYYFSGHIHPCVTLKGVGRQSLKLPCYYFNDQFAILPAFGKFTGCAMISPAARDKVFAILPSDIKKGEQACIIRL